MLSMTMCWLLVGIIFIQSVVSIDAESIKISQFGKLVADLKVNRKVLSRTISEM